MDIDTMNSVIRSLDFKIKSFVRMISKEMEKGE